MGSGSDASDGSPPCGGLVGCPPPSGALDFRLTNEEVQSRVGRRLGVELNDEIACPLCMQVMNNWGAHAEACTCGGDKTMGHNVVRDDLDKQAQAARVAPELEAANALVSGAAQERSGDAASDSRRRPADVLLCRAQDVRTGRVGDSGRAKAALDVGVVCPQAAGHIVEAAGRALGAAEEYAIGKCGRDEMERKCAEAGVVYQPMLFESTGGVASKAKIVIKCLNRAVANNTNVSYSDVAQRFWQRLSIDIQRSGHRA